MIPSTVVSFLICWPSFTVCGGVGVGVGGGGVGFGVVAGVGRIGVVRGFGRGRGRGGGSGRIGCDGTIGSLAHLQRIAVPGGPSMGGRAYENRFDSYAQCNGRTRSSRDVRQRYSLIPAC